MKITCHKNKLPLLLMIVTTACADFLEIDPPQTEIVNATVFSNDASATAVMRGVYSLMMTNQSFTNGRLELYTGLSADEFTNYSNRNEQQQFAEPALVSNNPVILNTFWREAYRYIHNVNTLLDGLAGSSLSPATREVLEGEATFVRAYCHFYLVTLFGEIPYLTTSDYRANAGRPRASIDAVYEQLVADLQRARALLRDDFTAAQGNRTQPNRSAATALLARIKLYQGKWAEAEQLSSELISNNTYTLLEDLTTVFLAGSTEAIWQLQPVTPDKSTTQAKLFIMINDPRSLPGLGGVSLSPEQVNAFEPGDLRFTTWVASFSLDDETWYYSNKYTSTLATTIKEHAAVLRLAEQYLIRAEARAQQDKIALAVEDVDMVRGRAGLPRVADTNPAITQAELLLAIEHERQVELFAEGHRWLDLHRTNRASDVLAPIKSDWQQTDGRYPIPESERLNNPALTQNPGY